MLDTDLLDRAIRFAVLKHSGTHRKGTDIPYIVHPMEAAAIVAGFTDDQEVIAAAVLHDTLEDTDTTKEELIREFGQHVADLVAAESEDKQEDQPADVTWHIRKQIGLKDLLFAGREASIIALGDKLSNMRAIDRDFRKEGFSFWKRFNQPDPEQQGEYYKALGNIFASKAYLWDSWALDEYQFLVNRTFDPRIFDPNDDPYEPECGCFYMDDLDEIREARKRGEAIADLIMDRTEDEETQAYQTIAMYYHSLFTGPNYCMDNIHLQITNDPDGDIISWKKTDDGYALKLCVGSENKIGRAAYQIGFLMMHCLIDYRGRLIGRTEGIAWAEDLICLAAGVWAVDQLHSNLREIPLSHQDYEIEDEIWAEYCTFRRNNGTSALKNCKDKETLRVLNRKELMDDWVKESHDLEDRIEDWADILALSEIRRFEVDDLLLNTKAWMQYSRYSNPVGYVCGLQERIPGCKRVEGGADYTPEPSFKTFFTSWKNDEVYDMDVDEPDDMDDWEGILEAVAEYEPENGQEKG